MCEATILTIAGAIGSVACWFLLNRKFMLGEAWTKSFYIICVGYGMLSALAISFKNDAFHCNAGVLRSFEIAMFIILVAISISMYFKYRFKKNRS